MRVAYFSAGDVGAGHLMRGLAIQRGLARRGVSAEVRVVYGALPFPAPPGIAVDAVTLDRAELADPKRAPDSAVARALRAFAPDLLVVDLFWGPLRHVLPRLGCEAWLLVRDCHPHWLRGPFHAGIDEAPYARILGIEPAVSVAVRESIEPIVVCNRDECLPPSALRERLAVPPDATLTVVAQAGARGERDALVERRAAGPGEVVVACGVDAGPAIVPLAPWLPGADRIVGGAGYNLVWETHWLGLSGRAELAPFARTNDDQAKRLRVARDHRMRANGADVLAAMIAGR